MRVVILTRPQIDWEKFLLAAKHILGRSITDAMDRRGARHDLPDFLTCLADIKSKGINHERVLSNLGDLAGCISYTMLTAGDERLRLALLESTPLSVYSETGLSATLIILSGNLSDWRTAIINGLAEHSPQVLKALMTECFRLLEGEGVGRLWSDYKQVEQQNGLVKLTPK